VVQSTGAPTRFFNSPPRSLDPTAGAFPGQGRSEVDAHHDAPLGGPADLGEAGGGEGAAAADVELAPGDLLARLGEHRVAFQRPGAALAGPAFAMRASGAKRLHSL